MLNLLTSSKGTRGKWIWLLLDLIISCFEAAALPSLPAPLLMIPVDPSESHCTPVSVLALPARATLGPCWAPATLFICSKMQKKTPLIDENSSTFTLQWGLMIICYNGDSRISPAATSSMCWAFSCLDFMTDHHQEGRTFAEN